jgi:hypothetical protein
MHFRATQLQLSKVGLIIILINGRFRLCFLLHEYGNRMRSWNHGFQE